MSDVIRELSARLDLLVNDSGFKKAEGLFGGLSSTIGKLGVAFGGILGGKAALNFVETNLKLGGSFHDTAAKIGITAESFQEWSHVAEQAGSSSESVTKAIGFLNKNLGDAQLGNEAAQKTFAQLGITLKDNQGHWKTSDDIINEFSDNLAKLPNIAQRTSYAQKLLGRGGKDLVSTFGQGSKVIREQIKALRDIGGVLSNETADAFDKADDNLNTFKKGWQGLKFLLISSLLPAINKTISKISELIVKFREIEKEFGVLKPLILGIGAALAVMLAPVIAKAALAATAIFAIGVVLEDLIALFEGKKSAIGAFLSELLGLETAKDLIHGIKDAVSSLIDELNGLNGPSLLTIFTTSLLTALDAIRLIVKNASLLKSVFTGDWAGVKAKFNDLKEFQSYTGKFVNKQEDKRIDTGSRDFSEVLNLSSANPRLAPEQKYSDILNMNSTVPQMAPSNSVANSTTNKSNVTNNIKFDITSNNPEEVAAKVREEIGNMLSFTHENLVQSAE